MMKAHLLILLVCTGLMLAGCSFNPFGHHNKTTGSAEGVMTGAAIGAGSMSTIGMGSKPYMGTAAVIGGIVGYYVTSESFAKSGIIAVGGHVYTVGQYAVIVIPSDKLFEPQSAELLPNADNVLDSVAMVLARYPNNNILVSANTSGFGRETWEKVLSEKQARAIAAYLLNAGINGFQKPGITTRKLRYVGYGHYFPISSDLTTKGIHQNYRIQITSYPNPSDLCINSKRRGMRDMGQ